MLQQVQQMDAEDKKRSQPMKLNDGTGQPEFHATSSQCVCAAEASGEWSEVDLLARGGTFEYVELTGPFLVFRYIQITEVKIEKW